MVELTVTSAPLVSSEMEQVDLSELSAVPGSKRILTLGSTSSNIRDFECVVESTLWRGTDGKGSGVS